MDSSVVILELLGLLAILTVGDGADKPGLCPDGSQPVNCFVAPCQFAKCPAFPDATCFDNYCGGCIADWYIQGELVDCKTPICDLPIDSGPCYAHFPSWGFNSEKGVCEEFVYGGCLGNANRFETLEECQDQCVCQLPLETGPCEALFNRYGFGTGECVEFTYGGCEGNGNNFETLSECEDSCDPPQTVCDLPVDIGPCDGLYKRWAFTKGRCVSFPYGGCNGNGNNFLTQKECAIACGPY